MAEHALGLDQSKKFSLGVYVLLGASEYFRYIWPHTLGLILPSRGSIFRGGKPYFICRNHIVISTKIGFMSPKVIRSLFPLLFLICIIMGRESPWRPNQEAFYYVHPTCINIGPKIAMRPS